MKWVYLVCAQQTSLENYNILKSLSGVRESVVVGGGGCGDHSLFFLFCLVVLCPVWIPFPVWAERRRKRMLRMAVLWPELSQHSFLTLPWEWICARKTGGVRVYTYLRSAWHCHTDTKKGRAIWTPWRQRGMVLDSVWNPLSAIAVVGRCGSGEMYTGIYLFIYKQGA